MLTINILTAAFDALNKLAKIGSTDKNTVKRLSKMLTFCKTHLDEFFQYRDTEMQAAFLEKDGQKVTKTHEDGSQSYVYRNEVELTLKLNEKSREPLDIQPEISPKPFSDEDLDRFKEFPPADVIANLGPFYVAS